MTCEEFWRLEPVSTDEMTAAELGAWYGHMEACRECEERFDREAEESLGRLTPAEIEECILGGIHDALRVLRDPEATP